MNDPTLVRYLKTCCRRLNQQQTSLIEQFSLRTCTAIEVQLATGLMTLEVPGRGPAIATVTPIARYQPASLGWRWAWAESAASSRHDYGAKALQGLADTTGLDLFTSGRLTVELEQASLLVAMACRRLKASGCYRWVDGDDYVFLAINHLAFATAALESSGNGDRLQLSQLNEPSQQSQLSQMVCPSPSLLGNTHPALTWPSQRLVEGLFLHTLCQGDLSALTDALVDLKALHYSSSG